MNKRIILMGGLASVAVVPTVAVALSRTTGEEYLSVGNRSEYTNYTIDETSLDGTTTLDDGAVNVYYTKMITPFQFITKHAFLSKNETHLWLYEGQEYQKRFRSAYFNEYKMKTHEADNSYKMGYAHNVELNTQADQYGSNQFMKWVINELKTHKNKKYNIFLNEAHITEEDELEYQFMGKKILNILSEFPNVQLHLIEDGTSWTRWMLVKRNEVFEDYGTDFFHKAHEEFMKSQRMSNTRYYTSIFNDADIQKVIAQEKLRIFNLSSSNLGDKIFSDRLANQPGTSNPVDLSFRKGGTTRLMGIFPLITGNDITEFINQFNIIKKNNLPNLLILGGYGLPEIDYLVKSVLPKYEGKFNLFYKGHPGHTEYTESVIKIVNNNERDVLKQRIHILDPDIPSEEFTNNHVKSDNLFFDKFVALGHTGSLDHIHENGVNTKTDVLEVYDSNNPNGGPYVW